jgi:hypothetical protein
LQHEEIAEFLEGALDSAEDSPSIYLIVWCNRTTRLTDMAFLLLTISAQLFLPCLMIWENWPEGAPLSSVEDGPGMCPKEAHWSTKVSAFILLFVATAFGQAAEDEIFVFHYLEFVKNHGSYRWVLHLGQLVQRLSFTSCVCATYILFLADPTLLDLMLNCVALFFVLDVDNTITAGRKRGKIHASRAIAKIRRECTVGQGKVQHERWIDAEVQQRVSLIARFRPRPNVCTKWEWIMRYLSNTVLRVVWFFGTATSWIVMVGGAYCL